MKITKNGCENQEKINTPTIHVNFSLKDRDPAHAFECALEYRHRPYGAHVTLR